MLSLPYQRYSNIVYYVCMVYFMALTVFLSGYTTRLGGSDDMTQEATVRIPTAVKTVDPTDKLSRDPMQK